MSSSHERWLVLRSQAGDRDAFDELLTSIQGDVSRYVGSLMRWQGEADDVVQDIFLTVVKEIRSLREPSLFRPWLFRIASRKTFRALRADRDWKNLTADESGSQLVASSTDAELTRAEADELISRLSIASRAVIAMRYLEDLKQEEIATALGISVGTVKSRIAYGLKQLREKM